MTRFNTLYTGSGFCSGQCCGLAAHAHYYWLTLQGLANVQGDSTQEHIPVVIRVKKYLLYCLKDSADGSLYNHCCDDLCVAECSNYNLLLC